jgi:hydrogenase expression/formation protein HypC
MQIEQIDGSAATAVLSGTRRQIHLDILDEDVRVGDYVIVHAGFAIHKIDEKEAQETLDLFKQAGVFASGSEADSGIH